MTPQDGTDEDLFAPSITGDGAGEDAQPPWRVESQGYLAFLGGALAVGTIAYINCARLGIGSRRPWIVAIVVLALVIEAVFVSVSGWDSGWLPLRIVAMSAYGGMYLIQRNADRRFHYYGSGEYSSLVGPGFVVGILGLGTELLLLAAISGGSG